MALFRSRCDQFELKRGHRRPLIPAKAGMSGARWIKRWSSHELSWIPAFAGMSGNPRERGRQLYLKAEAVRKANTAL
jgi:hypothetical protein